MLRCGTECPLGVQKVREGKSESTTTSHGKADDVDHRIVVVTKSQSVL